VVRLVTWFKIEIEVDTLAPSLEGELESAIGTAVGMRSTKKQLGPGKRCAWLCDTVAIVSRGVADLQGLGRRHHAPRLPLPLAANGRRLISVGWMTHSATALDMASITFK